MTTQNIDRRVSMRDFSDAAGKLAVTSMFNTLQGEGPFAGHPAVFVRLAGCNFGDKQDVCKFCDTFFALNKAEWLAPEEVGARVDAIAHRSRLVVITGGEPLLQTNLWQLLDLLISAGYHVQIESNGTQPKFFERTLPPEVSLVVSPKANERLKKYHAPHMTVLAETDALKFLLSADPGSVYHTIPDWGIGATTLKVYVSPIAVYKKAYVGEVSSIWDTELIDAEATRRNYAYAAEYALLNGLLLSLQTHLFTAIP